jgi:hypothetical protein
MKPEIRICRHAVVGLFLQFGSLSYFKSVTYAKKISFFQCVNKQISQTHLKCFIRSGTPSRNKTEKSFSNLAASQFYYSRSNKSTTTLQFLFLQGCATVALQDCVIVALQGCVIVALRGCVIVALQSCVIVALQGCMIVALQGCVIVASQG